MQLCGDKQCSFFVHCSLVKKLAVHSLTLCSSHVPGSFPLNCMCLKLRTTEAVYAWSEFLQGKVIPSLKLYNNLYVSVVQHIQHMREVLRNEKLPRCNFLGMPPVFGSDNRLHKVSLLGIFSIVVLVHGCMMFVSLFCAIIHRCWIIYQSGKRTQAGSASLAAYGTLLRSQQIV